MNEESCNEFRKVVALFGDTDSFTSPFSIHTLVKLGEVFNKKPGDYYDISLVLHLMRYRGTISFGFCKNKPFL